MAASLYALTALNTSILLYLQVKHSMVSHTNAIAISKYNSELVHTYHPVLDIYVRPEEIHLLVNNNLFLHEQIEGTTTGLNSEALQATLIIPSYVVTFSVCFPFLLADAFCSSMYLAMCCFPSATFLLPISRMDSTCIEVYNNACSHDSQPYKQHQMMITQVDAN